ncbi:sugar transferase [Candidatus Woesearchaeota archaeon]|nr:sugar transferase [Candidatus Woesearchaeota archaeon]
MKFYHTFKRICEFFISGIALIILFPLFFIVFFLVKFTSKGPAIYKHTRVGIKGKKFKIWKFRTMLINARELQSEGFSNDEVSTKVGKILRKTFIDELLQLVNVFKGDMSLVGPRPLDEELHEKHMKIDKRWIQVLKIRPGITSLESVLDYLPEDEKKPFEEKFGNLAKTDKYKDYLHHRLVVDKYYIKHESLFFDLSMIYYTIILMLRKILNI